jgi:LuxR family maltose regulon positive regulatory protein
MISNPDILRTKLLPPRLHSTAILREALLARLASDAERKVTLVVAPAGFGKTTLVNQWLRGNHAGQEPTRAVAWLSLDEDDNEAERFWRYLIAACQSVHPTIGQAALAQLEAPLPMPFAPPPLTAASMLLLNDLAGVTTPTVIVIDDYHLMTDEAIHTTLAFFLERLPDLCHVVLIARHTPPLSLARLRAHGDLTELHADALRFTFAESEQFLAQTLPVPLEKEAITRLWERTEGWAVGLRLAALALRNGSTPAAMNHVLNTFNGSQPAVVEYLVGDVLQAQPDNVQEFLLQTALFDTLTGSLCDAVTGGNDSAGRLAELAQRHFFLQSLEDGGGWYRYHALFAEAMRHEADRRFGAEGLKRYFQRASGWYERQGMVAEAIEAALAAADWNRAVALLEPLLGQPTLSDPQTPHRTRRWLEQLPSELLRQSPILSFAMAIVLIRSFGPRQEGVLARAEQYRRDAETGWRQAGNHARLAEVYAARMLLSMWSRDMEGASRWAVEAVARLPREDTTWRGLCLGFVGRSELRAGKLHAARRTLLEAKAGSEALNNNYATRAHVLMLAYIGIEQGDLSLAAELYRQALPSAEADGDLSDQSPAHLGLARLAYEANDLARAATEAQTAIATAAQLKGEEWSGEATLLLAQIERAQNHPHAALQRLVALLARLSPQRSAALYRETLAVQARIKLALGDLEAVRGWLATVHDVEAPLTQQAQEQETLLIVRLRLAEGEPQTALRLLAGMAERATADGRLLTVLEVQLLTAFAYGAQGERDTAIALLSSVLTRTYGMGVRRFFLDEGDPCATLLRAAVPTLTDPAIRAYAQSLLQGFVVAQHETGTLPLLSPQEQRVLELLATGQSYQEIAQTLIVSVNTIKTQLRHIYRKLGVTSRQEAIDLARRLDLLSSLGTPERYAHSAPDGDNKKSPS